MSINLIKKDTEKKLEQNLTSHNEHSEELTFVHVSYTACCNTTVNIFTIQMKRLNISHNFISKKVSSDVIIFVKSLCGFFSRARRAFLPRSFSSNVEWHFKCVFLFFQVIFSLLHSKFVSVIAQTFMQFVLLLLCFRYVAVAPANTPIVQAVILITSTKRQCKKTQTKKKPECEGIRKVHASRHVHPSRHPANRRANWIAIYINLFLSVRNFASVKRLYCAILCLWIDNLL